MRRFRFPTFRTAIQLPLTLALCIVATSSDGAPDAGASPEPAPTNAARPFPLYSVGMMFIQIHGKPDWAFWTQPFKDRFEFAEGAGRVFGPVDVTEFWSLSGKGLDFSLAGFPNLAANDSQLISSPRVTGTLDHRAHVRDGSVPNEFKIVLGSSANRAVSSVSNVKGSAGIGESVGRLYNALALATKTLKREDLEGTIMIADANFSLDDQRRMVIPASGKLNGLMAILEADSTETPGVYRLDQGLLIHETLLAKAKAGWKSDPRLLHAQIDCDYAVRNGSATAFLLPVAEDEYLFVLTTFNVLPGGRAKAAEKNGTVIEINPARTPAEAPFMTDVTLLRVAGPVGIVGDEYFANPKTARWLGAFRPDESARAIEMGGIQIGETLVRLGATGEAIPGELLRESPQVSSLRVPPLALPAGYAKTSLFLNGTSPFPWVEAPGTKANATFPQGVFSSISLGLQSTITEGPGDQLEVHWAMNSTHIAGYETTSAMAKLTRSREYAHFETHLGQRVAILTALGNSKDEVLVTLIRFSRSNGAEKALAAGSPEAETKSL